MRYAVVYMQSCYSHLINRKHFPCFHSYSLYTVETRVEVEENMNVEVSVFTATGISSFVKHAHTVQWYVPKLMLMTYSTEHTSKATNN